ncbi:hypothetical protein K7X08_007061 [Anisodus acutangulus]|uniref:Uncharacterized protein n=1 Tax=Anisodus acutangulus TaxID=402998 RepID=A0A9Q1LEY2_9SOLA|nr:hypothetical protein K7X08_007061 [Anisodus acutangulus]
MINQQTSQSISEAAGPSKSKRESKYKPVAPSKRSAKKSVEGVDEDEDQSGLEDEDEQPILRPNVTSEAKTRLQLKKM